MSKTTHLQTPASSVALAGERLLEAMFLIGVVHAVVAVVLFRGKRLIWLLILPPSLFIAAVLSLDGSIAIFHDGP